MIDFQKIEEIYFLVFAVDQILVLGNIIIDKDNACEFVQNTFDT